MTSYNDDLQDMHRAVAELCVILGDDPDKVMCDLWRVHEHIQRLRNTVEMQEMLLERSGKQLDSAERVFEAMRFLTDMGARYSLMHGGTHYKECTLSPAEVLLVAVSCGMPSESTEPLVKL